MKEKSKKTAEEQTKQNKESILSFNISFGYNSTSKIDQFSMTFCWKQNTDLTDKKIVTSPEYYQKIADIFSKYKTQQPLPDKITINKQDFSDVNKWGDVLPNCKGWTESHINTIGFAGLRDFCDQYSGNNVIDIIEVMDIFGSDMII